MCLWQRSSSPVRLHHLLSSSTGPAHYRREAALDNDGLLAACRHGAVAAHQYSRYRGLRHQQHEVHNEWQVWVTLIMRRHFPCCLCAAAMLVRSASKSSCLLSMPLETAAPRIPRSLIIGTMDGANIEIGENIDFDNMFIFGAESHEVARLRRERTHLQVQGAL